MPDATGPEGRAEGLAEMLLTALVRCLWSYHWELGLLGGLAWGWYELARIVGRPAASGVIASLVAVIVAVAPLRRGARRFLHAARTRRVWSRAIRALAIPVLAGRIPAVSRVRRVPSGELLEIRVPAGATAGDLEDKAEALAVVLAVREVRVHRDPTNAAKAGVVVVRRDPLAGPRPIAWPHLGASALSLWEPIPVGVNEDGEEVFVSLCERNVLFGGEPGAGKSGALAPLVATAALDASVKLWLLDGKLVELATWAGCAEHCVGVEIAEAIDVLGSLRVEMDLRYAELLARRRRKVQPEDGLSLHVVVVDELAHYLTTGERKARQDFIDLLRDLVSRGRAAGVVVLAATQKPSADIVPSSIRDLFGFRWALRCSTPQASDTILGSGWASAGYSAAVIDPALRGVGYLLHEGGIPVRLRSHYLTDDDLSSIAERAETVRRGQGPAPRNEGRRQ